MDGVLITCFTFKMLSTSYQLGKTDFSSSGIALFLAGGEPAENKFLLGLYSCCLSAETE